MDNRTPYFDAPADEAVPVDVFIVGAMKAGTSNIQDRLSDHPSVYFPYLKEPNYFLFEGGCPEFTGPGDEKINRLAVKGLDAYRDLYKRAPDGAVRGDASTTYLFDPDVAERIAARRPDAKIVILLRNPIDRAYSAFNHLRRDGREPLDDFEQALEAEDERAELGWEPLWRYLAGSMYAAQVEQYLEHFPRGAMYIDFFEHLVVSEEEVLRGLCRFLNINAEVLGTSAIPRNASGIPTNPRLRRALSAETPWRLKVKRAFPKAIRDVVVRVRDRSMIKPPPLDRDVRDQLRNRLATDVTALSDLLEGEPHRWWVDF